MGISIEIFRKNSKYLLTFDFEYDIFYLELILNTDFKEMS